MTALMTPSAFMDFQKTLDGWMDEEIGSCSTVAPSPELSATSYHHVVGSQRPQEFEALILEDDGGAEDISTAAGAAAAVAATIPYQTYDGTNPSCQDDVWPDLPPGLEEVSSSSHSAETGLSLSAQAACFVPEEMPNMNFFYQASLNEVPHWDGGYFDDNMLMSDQTMPEQQHTMSEQTQETVFGYPGHAETGDWAWRMAPRPGSQFDEFQPLIVKLGGAPDGSASLEVAIGLPDLLRTHDEEESEFEGEECANQAEEEEEEAAGLEQGDEFKEEFAEDGIEEQRQSETNVGEGPEKDGSSKLLESDSPDILQNDAITVSELAQLFTR